MKLIERTSYMTEFESLMNYHALEGYVEEHYGSLWLVLKTPKSPSDGPFAPLCVKFSCNTQSFL